MNTVFLDKTGTLTFGTPVVNEVFTSPGNSETVLLATAASAEWNSEHPLGRAIVRYAEDKGIHITAPDSFQYRIGRGSIASSQGESILVGNHAFFAEHGISTPSQSHAENGTRVLVSRNGRYLGALTITDQLRPSSTPAVKALQQMNIKVALLTGDTQATAARIAEQLGITQVYSNMLPEQKTALVAEEVKKNRVVAMLGDGINDAPALAEASVGVAMGAGTDVARESADVVLIGNDLTKFVETVRIAGNCRRIILQNFYGTLIVDTMGIALAALGFLNPLLATFIHVASELIFILNSTRLLPPGTKHFTATEQPEL